MKNPPIFLLLALPTSLISPISQAFEGPQQYPLGAENFMAGALPPPGHYLINYLIHYQGDMQDNNSTSLPINVKITADALRYVYVSPYQLLGGNWAMHAVVPLISQHVNTPFPLDNDRIFGLGDITLSPLIIGWHFPPDWHWVLGVDINAPTGRYDRTDPTASTGTNFWSFEPAMAVTYLNRGGFEISAKLMYNFKTENHETHYQSGDDFHMDYVIAQHFGPWAIGLGGYYLKQIEDDRQRGIKVGFDGHRAEVFAFGPAIKYDEQGMSFIATWNHEKNVENYFEGDKFYLKFITAF